MPRPANEALQKADREQASQSGQQAMLSDFRLLIQRFPQACGSLAETGEADPPPHLHSHLGGQVHFPTVSTSAALSAKVSSPH